MLFPLSHLSRKNIDTLFKNLSSHHVNTPSFFHLAQYFITYPNLIQILIQVKTLVRTAKTKRKSVDLEAEGDKKRGIPIITCKRPNFNFYKGDKYNKWKPVLVSETWNHRGSRGDYFFIHPYDIVCYSYNLYFLFYFFYNQYKQFIF